MRNSASKSRSICLFILVPQLLTFVTGCGRNQAETPVTTSALGDRPAPSVAAPSPTPSPPPAFAWNGNPSRIETGSVAPAAPTAAPQGLIWNASPRPPERQPAPVAVAATLPLAPGEIEVKPGETLYSLSRRHGVPVAALVDTNRLASVDLKSGQRLRLPPGAR